MLDFRLKTPTEALTPCITSDDAAKWVRIDTGNTVEKEQVESLVLSAMTLIETRCHQPIFEREYYGFGASLCHSCLHSLNVTAVSKVEYQVTGSSDWTELAAEHYTFWESGEVWFYSVAGIASVSRVRITYKAGYPAGQVPADIIQAVRLLVGRWYDVRADEKKEVPSQAEWLYTSYVLPIA